MKIIMTLKSDAIPGSGKSLAGIIDRDIAYDETGLPYIPAKRLKGILRESAEDLRLDSIDRIFGVEGATRGAVFRLDNGLLENHLELSRVLKSESIKRFLPTQAVLDFYTYTRSQTTIENGVAKENSLRTSRVLKKGLKFFFNLDCDPDDIAVLQDVCRVTRSIGASRTRGFGEIELELIEEEPAVEPSSKAGKVSLPAVEDDALVKMRIDVHNLEQLLISTRPGKSQISDNYIPGTVILGALAGSYLKTHTDTEKSFIELFMSGKVSFGNLYPRGENQHSLYTPPPLSIKKVKEDKNRLARADYYDHLFFDETDEDCRALIDSAIFKGGISGFTTGGLDYSVDTMLDMEAHHQRPANRGFARATPNEGEFYQFEVIAMGQDFAGEIIGPEKLLRKLLPYFPDSGILRLGKSKTGQYGKCRFELGEIVALPKTSTWPAGEKLHLLFTADMILLNDCGFAVPDINLFVKQLTAYLNLEEGKIKLERQFSATTAASGFMGVWRMPRPQNPAVAAGTVVTLLNNSGKDIDLPDPESLFFGERVGDGFGRVAEYKPVKSLHREEGAVAEPGSVADNSSASALCSANLPPEFKSLIEFRIREIVGRNLSVAAIAEVKQPIPINSFIAKIIALLKAAGNYEELNRHLTELKSEKQKVNLRKIGGKIFIITNDNNNRRVDSNKFKRVLAQCCPVPAAGGGWLQEVITEINAALLEPEPDFALYQHYALTYLNQQKFSNRN